MKRLLTNKKVITSIVIVVCLVVIFSISYVFVHSIVEWFEKDVNLSIEIRGDR